MTLREAWRESARREFGSVPLWPAVRLDVGVTPVERPERWYRCPVPRHTLVLPASHLVCVPEAAWRCPVRACGRPLERVERRVSGNEAYRGIKRALELEVV